MGSMPSASGAARADGRVGEDAIAWVQSGNLVEQQRRTARCSGRDLGDRSDLEICGCSADALQVADAFDPLDEFPQILIIDAHCGSPLSSIGGQAVGLEKAA